MGENKILKATITKATIGSKSKPLNEHLGNTNLYSYIIVIGLQAHAGDWKKNAVAPFYGGYVGEGSKLMFVHQALRRMKLNNGDIKYEVLLCNSIVPTHYYSKNQVTKITEAVRGYGGILIEVKNADEIINYINKGDIKKSSTKKRNNFIKQLIFYSHGLVGELALGMPPLGNSTSLSIKEEEVNKMNKIAFSSACNIYSFACRTGLGNHKVDKSVYINPKGNKKDPNNKYNLLSSESLAQKLADKTGATVFAYLCRSDYAETLFTKDELCFKDYYQAREKKKTRVENARCGDTYKHLLNQNYKLTEAEKARIKEWKEIESNMIMIDKAWFDPDGARHPVKGGTTPEGTPNDMKTYKPKY
ncbi:hypothetical protein ETU08_02280 [Apibacter muscae]|uniref:hypothetical protein n=1 Tax=Apibacter muscae TaxID=2509004 RepID=UPI0011AC026A|nr:hypothetical protein [Apibacter muscae]TWP30850.1 hypothetical protein ETU08_02280 [Apibacter muscae]